MKKTKREGDHEEGEYTFNGHFFGTVFGVSFTEQRIRPIPKQKFPPKVTERTRMMRHCRDADSEPNNDINRSNTIQFGCYAGRVGRNDPHDFFRICAPSGGFGHLVTFELRGGQAQLSLLGGGDAPRGYMRRYDLGVYQVR